MATDTKISALPANPGVTTSDVLEVLDVSNTTNQATGENTKATVAQLAAAIGAGGSSAPFGPAGPSHAAGSVPDPGATAHGTPYIFGDDGTFHPMLGSGMSYSGGGYTFAGGTGGAGTVTQITAVAPLTGGVITASGSIGLGTVPVANGGTGLTALGTALQVLRVNSGATGLEFAAPSGGGGTPGGTNGQIQTNASGSFGGSDLTALLDGLLGSTQGMVAYRGASAWSALAPGTAGFNLQAAGAAANPTWGTPRTPIFTVTGAGSNVVNTPAETSIFAGSTIGLGSLTIPANRLRLGSTIGGMLWGDWDGDGSATFTFKIKIGGTTVLMGVSAVMPSVVGKQWKASTLYLGVQVAGAAGKVVGDGAITGYSTSASGAWSCNLSTAGGGTASTQVTIDTTAALAVDVTVQWSTTSASDRFRLLGGSLWIDG